MLLPRRPRTTSRRVVAGLAAVLTGSAVALLPWIAYLDLTLPSSVTARHWPLAWAGLDAAMAAGLAVTGVLAIRGDRRVAFAAASTATVLLADAWFDVCTAAAGRPLMFALADLCLEVGEAAGCVLLAWAVWHHPPARGSRRPRGRGPYPR